MRVAVLGTGSIGFASAAFLTQQGHQAALWSPSGEGIKGLAGGEKLVASGKVEGAFSVGTAVSCGEAVEGADAVLIAVPGNGHRAVMDALAPVLKPGQTVLINSHCSLSALYLSKLLVARGIEVPIVAWGSTVVSGRRTGPAAVRVNAIRRKLDAVALPVSGTDAGIALCVALFGDRFVPRADLLAISLSNLNPQNHMAMALCNITRMERGENWGNYEMITPVVGRLIEALDAERLAVAAKFGLEVRTVRDHFHLSFDAPMGSVADMAQFIHARDGGPPGPTTVESRYVLEDVPFGLVGSEALARIAGVAVPLHRSGIDVYGGLYGRDFRAENTLLPELGLDGISAGDLQKLAREGWPR